MQVHLTEEDLRAIWRDLYTDAVKTSQCSLPDLVHRAAREFADAYVNVLLADMTRAAADLQARMAPPLAAAVAAQPPTAIPVRTAEDERRDVLAFMQTEINKQDDQAEKHMSAAARERCSARAEVLRTVSAYVERGDHIGAADRTEVKS